MTKEKKQLTVKDLENKLASIKSKYDGLAKRKESLLGALKQVTNEITLTVGAHNTVKDMLDGLSGKPKKEENPPNKK